MWENEPVQGYASVFQLLAMDARGGIRRQRTEAELVELFPGLNRNDITDGLSEFQMLQQRRPIQPRRADGKRGGRHGASTY